MNRRRHTVKTVEVVLVLLLFFGLTIVAGSRYRWHDTPTATTASVQAVDIALATTMDTSAASAPSLPTETLAMPHTPALTPDRAGIVGIGAYVEGMPYDGFVGLTEFEERVEHQMTYALWFQAWGDNDSPFPTQWVELASQRELIPIITWEPWRRNFADPTVPQPTYSLQSIAAGEHDTYIRSWAQACRAAGTPIIIRFAHEQSTEPGVRSWYPWQGDPDAYKAAYRHIVAVFRAERAGNVQFLWSGMWLDDWAGSYYPGDDVVDYVGTTVLNHGTEPTVSWAKWRTFDELFAAQYAAAEAWGKPIILTEFATAEQGGDKADWLRDAFTSLQADYSLVRGVLLLEVEQDREWPAINWSVTSSPESLDAFTTAVSGQYFK